MEAMLYQIYDWQRAALEPWRAFAQAANELYGHPDSPLSYLPGSRNVAAAFDLMTRLTQRYERPAFGIDFGEVRRARLRGEARCSTLEKPFCRLLHFAKVGAPTMPRVIVFAPLSGHFATLLSRHGEDDARRPRRVDHRLDRREGDPDRRGPVPLRRLRRLRARVPRVHGPRLPRDLGVPADGAGAGRGVAHGRRRRGHAAHAHDDGRADRHAPQSHGGEHVRHDAPALVVRGEGDPARADALSRASCAACIRASCSSRASSR